MGVSVRDDVVLDEQRKLTFQVLTSHDTIGTIL